jgi:hypothetical protein
MTINDCRIRRRGRGAQAPARVGCSPLVSCHPLKVMQHELPGQDPLLANDGLTSQPLGLNAMPRQLNERPRKTLGYRAPAEMLSQPLR